MAPSKPGWRRGRLSAVVLIAFGASIVGLAGLQTGASAQSAPAVVASGPNLGPAPQPCAPGARTCCPGANCFAHPELIPASPLLVQTAVGVESISSHEIHVGQRFTITFHAGSPTSAHWTFPSIAQKVSSCRAGVDLVCTYVARAADVTYPEFATFNGWTDYTWSGGDINGIGTGYGYYAIVSNRIAVSGRLADSRGRGIPRGGIQTAPGQPTPDLGVLIEFEAERHGQLEPIYGAAPSIHSSPAHPYDVGYYGLLMNPGTYVVIAGDPVTHTSCKRRTLHLSHSIVNFNLVCKRG